MVGIFFLFGNKERHLYKTIVHHVQKVESKVHALKALYACMYNAWMQCRQTGFTCMYEQPGCTPLLPFIWDWNTCLCSNSPLYQGLLLNCCLFTKFDRRQTWNSRVPWLNNLGLGLRPRLTLNFFSRKTGMYSFGCVEGWNLTLFVFILFELQWDFWQHGPPKVTVLLLEWPLHSSLT